MSAYELLGQAIGAVCSWLLYIAGRLLRRQGRAAAVGIVVIAGGGWVMMMSAGGFPQIQLPQFVSGFKAMLPAWVPRGTDTSFVTRDWAQAFLGVLRDNSTLECDPYRSGPLAGSCGVTIGPWKWTYEGRDYWIEISATKTLVDGGEPVTRVCNHLYAVPAIKNDGQYLKPPLPNYLNRQLWPEVITRCVAGGAQATYEYPTLHESGIDPRPTVDFWRK